VVRRGGPDRAVKVRSATLFPAGRRVRHLLADDVPAPTPGSPAIDQEIRRIGANCVVQAHLPYHHARCEGIGMFLQVSLRFLFVPSGPGNHNQSPVSVRLVNLLQIGRRLETGTATRVPEVQENDLSVRLTDFSRLVASQSSDLSLATSTPTFWRTSQSSDPPTSDPVSVPPGPCRRRWPPRQCGIR